MSSCAKRVGILSERVVILSERIVILSERHCHPEPVGRMTEIARDVVLASGASRSRAASPAGSWSSGPALPVARSEVAVAVLADRIYVIGGYANGNVDQRLVEVFQPVIRGDAVRGDWQDVAPLPRGLNHSPPSATVERYTRLADLQRKTTRPSPMQTSTIPQRIDGRRLPRSRVRSARFPSPCSATRFTSLGVATYTA